MVLMAQCIRPTSVVSTCRASRRTDRGKSIAFANSTRELRLISPTAHAALAQQ